MTYPAYLALLKSGELDRRREQLQALASPCVLCPRECGVNRAAGETGFCRSGSQPIVMSICDHHGEEPPISGRRGSGTVFFGNCNLRCHFCQNWQISQAPDAGRRKVLEAAELARALLGLQERGVHNINFVSPSHVVPSLVEAVALAARQGLRLPLVYNSNGYDGLAALQLLDGVVDIYLPDLKYADNASGRKYSGAVSYWEHAQAALREMHRQVGVLAMDGNGVAVRGLLIRHLVLPNGLAGTERALKFVAGQLSAETHLSLMAQYQPAHRARAIPALARRITPGEYREALKIMEDRGLENGFSQDVFLAPETYNPDFSRDGHPFAD